MKPWKSHPRVVLGDPIHETQARKKKIEKKHTEKDMLLKIQHEEISKSNIDASETDVEKLLIPEIKNFVETKEVEELKNRIKMWLRLGYPVHIIGPTGCGKTTIALQVAKEMNKQVLWINGDEEMSTTDLIGGYSELETNSLRDKFIHNVLKVRDIYKAEWIDNPLTLACKYGYALVYNEFARSLPQANNILLSIFEEKILELPTKFGPERYIKVNPNFIAIFTSNSTEYAGVHKPQDALLDRMIGVYMDYYNFETEQKIVKANSKIPDAEAAKVVNVIRELRERLKEGERPGTRACILLAQGIEALGSFRKNDYRGICLDVLASKVNGKSGLEERSKIIDKVLHEVLV